MSDYKITKLYRTNRHGEVFQAAALVEHGGGQMRKIEAMIGGPHSTGRHTFNLRGEGPLIVTVDADTTICVGPVE